MQLSDERFSFKQSFSDPRGLSLFSLFLALGIGLQALDNFISPFFVPGFKIGLAHLVTLLSLVYFSGMVVLLLVGLRVVLSSLLFGFFLSPTFYLSFFPSLVSSSAMIFLFIFLRRYLSFLGLSLTGSYLHNVSQLITASLLLGSRALLAYLALFSLLGLAAGFLNGVLANYLISRILLFNSSLKRGASP